MGSYFHRSNMTWIVVLAGAVYLLGCALVAYTLLIGPDAD